MLHHLLIEQSLLKFDESPLKFDESAISVKLSDGVRFKRLKVYFSKIKD